MISDAMNFDHPTLQLGGGLLLLTLLALIANWAARLIIGRILLRVLGPAAVPTGEGDLARLVRRLSNIVPALVVQLGIGFIPFLPQFAADLVRNLASAIVILTGALAVSHALTLVHEVYQRRPDAADRPIKGYIEVTKLVVYIAAAVLVVAALMDRSPMLLLSGLGAMAAVLMLVFKDTILSLVASVQLRSNDMVRVGDWIEMPQLNANGDVIDIALHTVKVQNFDLTITTIPTYRLISDSFKNWRGMREAGGRRIMRSLMIDQTSVRFLDVTEIRDLRRFLLIDGYLEAKETEITAWNEARPDRRTESVNARRLTNIGTFRAYVEAYLRDRADISDSKSLMVRQLEAGEHGLPLQLYCFTTTTVWASYEAIQSDIFDHLIAILPEFGLRLYQQPSGADLARLGQDILPGAANRDGEPVSQAA